MVSWLVGHHELDWAIGALPNFEEVGKRLARWPEDIASLLHDDPQYRRATWWELATNYPNFLTEAEYLMPAVEKAISAVHPEDIAEYVPPPCPGAPPQMKPLPGQRETLTWLLEQFDHYLHELQSALSKRGTALRDLVDTGGCDEWTKDERDRVLALAGELMNPCQKFPIAYRDTSNSLNA